MAVNPTLARDSDGGSLFPLPTSGEAFILKREDIYFECKLPGGGKLWGRGIFFLTTKRLVFVSTGKVCRADFKSFAVYLEALENPKFQQPIFGANYLEGLAAPLDPTAVESAPLQGGQAPFSLTFNSGGCQTFLSLFYQLLSDMEEAAAGRPERLQQAVQDGRLQHVAYSDPSDPSVLYLTQPTAAPGSQQQTDFGAGGAAGPGGIPQPSAPPPPGGQAQQDSGCSCM